MIGSLLDLALLPIRCHLSDIFKHNDAKLAPKIDRQRHERVLLSSMVLKRPLLGRDQGGQASAVVRPDVARSFNNSVKSIEPSEPGDNPTCSAAATLRRTSTTTCAPTRCMSSASESRPYRKEPGTAAKLVFSVMRRRGNR